MNEGELIVRLQQKDESAFRQLVEGWKDRIYNTALGLLQQEQDAEDITQEVFVAVWRTVDEFRGGSSVGTWLYRITVSKSLDLIRKNKRKKRLAFVKSLLGQTDRHENEIPEFSHPGVVLEKKRGCDVVVCVDQEIAGTAADSLQSPENGRPQHIGNRIHTQYFNIRC